MGFWEFKVQMKSSRNERCGATSVFLVDNDHQVHVHMYKQKNAEKRVKFVCDVDGKYGKNIGFPYWS